MIGYSGLEDSYRFGFVPIGLRFPLGNGGDPLLLHRALPVPFQTDGNAEHAWLYPCFYTGSVHPDTLLPFLLEGE